MNYPMLRSLTQHWRQVISDMDDLQLKKISDVVLENLATLNADNSSRRDSVTKPQQDLVRPI